MNLLFICSRNRKRSPTAEMIFNELPNTEAMSAGTEPDAEQPLDPELIQWADLIFVMERRHRRKVMAQFGALMKNKKIVCLDIPDRYAYMDEDLQRILRSKVLTHIQHTF